MAIKKPDKPDKQAENRKTNGQWQKGQSGNPNGRPKGKTLSESYRQALLKPVPDGSGLTYADSIALALVRRAARGDARAAKALADPMAELRQPLLNEEIARADRKRKHQPVRWSGDPDLESSEPQAPPIVREVWTVGGRQHVVESAAPDAPRAVVIEPVIRQGIPYEPSRRPAVIRNRDWEDI